MSSWYSQKQTDDVVVSTRIRLARNLNGFPFAARMDASAREKVNGLVKKAILESDTPFAKQLRFIAMNDVPENEVYAMVERHIISPDFAENRDGRAIIISQDESICVMIGEEDHIRIQVLLCGLQLEKAYDLANQIDELLSAGLSYAFDEQLGYLTECPTNLGTGMRASVMMHLPACENNGTVAQISEAIGKIGFTVRGIYGEGSKAQGALYQISNQITLGIAEKNAMGNLALIARQIAEKERAAREAIDRTTLEDAVWRAYGTLKYLRKVSSEETAKLISYVSMGVSMGILSIGDKNPMEMLIETQPHMLCRKFGEKQASERDVLRADMIRKWLQS